MPTLTLASRFGKRTDPTVEGGLVARALREYIERHVEELEVRLYLRGEELDEPYSYEVAEGLGYHRGATGLSMDDYAVRIDQADCGTFAGHFDEVRVFHNGELVDQYAYDAPRGCDGWPMEVKVGLPVCFLEERDVEMDIIMIRAQVDKVWRDYIRQRFGVSVRTSWDDNGITNQFFEDFEERTAHGDRTRVSFTSGPESR